MSCTPKMYRRLDVAIIARPLSIAVRGPRRVAPARATLPRGLLRRSAGPVPFHFELTWTQWGSARVDPPNCQPAAAAAAAAARQPPRRWRCPASQQQGAEPLDLHAQLWPSILEQLLRSRKPYACRQPPTLPFTASACRRGTCWSMAEPLAATRAALCLCVLYMLLGCMKHATDIPGQRILY